jgi:hypothetical protein
VKSRGHAGVVVAFCALLFAGVASAQSFQTGVTYVCNGERMLIESCNMRDVSDTSSCLVQHPDRPLHNGFVAYTNETRGTLNKLAPTCKQPSAADIAHAQAFAKKQQDKQDAILQKNLAAMDAPTPASGSISSGSSGSVKSQRDKARLARCISAGKTEGQCVGNEFGKAFEGVFAFAGSMLGMSAPQAGIYLNGVYQGKGGWNINFQPNSALVQCSDLVGRDQTYQLEFKGSQAVVHLENKPEPLVLNYRDGKLYGSAAVQVAGDIVVGTVGGTGGGGGSQAPQGMTANTSTQTTSREISGMEAEAYQRGGGTGTLQQSGPGYTLSETTTTTTYSAAPAPTPTYNTGPRIITAPRTRTCAAPILATSKTNGSGDMGNAVSAVGAMLGGEGATKAVIAPTGLRMLGEFAAPSGADIDFHDDSAIVACGLIAAQYPYTIEVSGSQPVLRLASTGKPTISFTVGADRTLTGTGDLQVTGRVAMGEDRDGNITYTSRSVSCPLGTLKPVTENSTDGLTTPSAVAASKTPSSASPLPAAAGSSANGAASAKPAGPAFAKPGAPTGNAVLTVVSGFPVQAGAPSLLGGRPYLLLRDNLGTALVKAGAAVPAGVSPHRAVKEACEQKTPDCRKYLLAISADAATGLAADASGKATLPGVPPGTYFLVVSNEKNTIYWELKLVLKSGANTASLGQHNAVPMQ